MNHANFSAAKRGLGASILFTDQRLGKGIRARRAFLYSSSGKYVHHRQTALAHSRGNEAIGLTQRVFRGYNRLDR